VLVDQGDTVKAGQLLARLDDGELQRQVDVAQAALASARATEERVRVDEVRAAAVERQARESHERTTKPYRSEDHFRIRFQQVHRTTAHRGVRKAARLAATTEAQQQVVTAEKNLAYQRERLGFGAILSPYDGLIIRPATATREASLFRAVRSCNSSRRRKSGFPPGWTRPHLRDSSVGQPALVVFRSEPEKQYPGEVARLGRETDRETREFLVDVGVHELPPNWTVGQRAEVFIETGKKPSALIVPPRSRLARGKTGRLCG